MTIVLIILAVLLIAGAGVFGQRVIRARQAKQAELRTRLADERDGHLQEMQANSAKATEIGDQAEAQRAQASKHRQTAAELEEQAQMHSRQAAELESSSDALDQRAVSARKSALRHDEKARQADERLP